MREAKLFSWVAELVSDVPFSGVYFSLFDLAFLWASLFRCSTFSMHFPFSESSVSDSSLRSCKKSDNMSHESYRSPPFMIYGVRHSTMAIHNIIFQRNGLLRQRTCSERFSIQR